MRSRPVVTALAMASVLFPSACSTGGHGGAGPSPSTSATAEDSGATVSKSPAAGPAGAVPPDTSRKSGEGHSAVQSTAGPALERVETSTHDTYDRVSFHFAGGTPGFFAEYVDVLRHGGRGEEYDISGDHRLKIVFIAVGAGSPVGELDTTPTLREVRDLSVFEGEHGIGIGIDSGDGDDKPGFRVSADATTVAVDVARS
ncbi:AMIN-like domain-containing (lipo)protein [Streptomyces pratensis]|uniref:AMIN-like domain-containing (lipo)protein n=1 Tax=Streptomyces pratensis TaxID=1169025 RepID=UPI0030187F91